MQVWLWGVLWSFFLVHPQSWSPLVVIWNPFLSHVIIQSRNGLLLLHKIREDDASKQHFFFPDSSWGTHLSSFFTFPICFKCQRLSLSFLAPFHVVARGLVLMMALNCCQLLIAHYRAPHLQTLVSFAKLLEPPLHYYLLLLMDALHPLPVPGPNALLMLWVISSVLQPSLNLINKIIWIYFLSNIVSLV